MGIDWGHGPKPDDDEGEEYTWKGLSPINLPPPMHPNCRCHLLEVIVLDWWKGEIRLAGGVPDWRAAGYNWPSAGDHRRTTENIWEALRVAHELNDEYEAEIGKLKEEKAVAATVNTLELEKLLELRGELRQLRRDRWIWFAWGAGLSPWLAMLLKWLAG